MRSAEGEIRCGTPPPCSVKQCTRSSDCADLGADYFCDSPGSGCCGDDKQRCIAPCKPVTCPAARICGGKCCPEGESCVAGACAAGGAAADAAAAATPVTGTWTGSVAAMGSTPVGIRFTLVEQNGRLTGQTFVEDPKTKAFLTDAELTGSRTGVMATWNTVTGLLIRGTFTTDTFTGTLQYPAEGDFGPLVSNLTLKR